HGAGQGAPGPCAVGTHHRSGHPCPAPGAGRYADVGGLPPGLLGPSVCCRVLPFHLQSFYATPSFARLGMAEEDGTLRGRMNIDGQTLAQVKILHAYAFILHQIYGIDLDFAYPLIFTTTDPQTGLERHFKPNLDGRFLAIKTVGEVPPLTDEAQQQVLANLAHPYLLMELLPPEQFVFQGFTVLTAEDVTDQEVLSALKRDLIEKESIV